MASVCVVAAFLLSFVFHMVVAVQQQQSGQIISGSSLSPLIEPTSWSSPSGQFAFGFFPQGNGFIVAIWLGGKPNDTVVWTANRGDPPVSSTAKIVLKEGKLVLITEQGEKPIADVTDFAVSASMLDSGNFVLYDKDSEVIWESFSSPTDSILGGQILASGHQLFSNLSENNYSLGRFHLDMQTDGNLVLYPANSVTWLDAYWSSNTVEVGSLFHLYLDYTGVLAIRRNSNLAIKQVLSPSLFSSDSIIMSNMSSSIDKNSSDKNYVIFRATVGVDGVLRLYAHTYGGNSSPMISVLWREPSDVCMVKGFCGFNSFCTWDDNVSVCRCFLPGFIFIDSDKTYLGCEKNYYDQDCRSGRENSSSYNITSMDGMAWDDFPYFEASMKIDNCSKSCLEDCNCGAALFQDGSCQKQSLPIRYAYRYSRKSDSSQSPTALLKLGPSIYETPITLPMPAVVVRYKNPEVMILIIIVGAISSSFVALAILGLSMFKLRILRYRWLLENRSLDATKDLRLRTFRYKELERATCDFKEELGKGSFGAVYKGTLDRGTKVIAVKRLEKVVEEGEREFQAEMRAIGKTHHRNLVRLLGYCVDGSNRLLVYEYMHNGSLADLLFRTRRRPDWSERVRIALDIAKGMLYLHDECGGPIIHCDIKPQNILMDEFWTAKISDFGLAKLLMPDQTRTFTGVRGTRGYLAPEWQKNAPVTVKADIYSYGIVLLEIVCCRRNLEVNVATTEEVVLSNWVYKCFVARELNKLLSGEDADMTVMERMIRVALWCIQDEPILRPSMKSVVLMLEGITDISAPPCPTSTSA
ncbi:Bulb-type lectin domain [Dillenia turbinata]|uniref:Receptor-like serine/threonine-protein kinase n=1 Tax=Dillenia turbinata TaxID=194707 RepID=A0AAN8UTB3_9MAGN